MEIKTVSLIAKLKQQNGIEELQLRLDEEGLRGIFLLIALIWAIRCSIGWGGSELRWPIIDKWAVQCMF